MSVVHFIETDKSRLRTALLLFISSSKWVCFSDGIYPLCLDRHQLKTTWEEIKQNIWERHACHREDQRVSPHRTMKEEKTDRHACISSMYITTERRTRRVWVWVYVCLCQVITMFQPWIAAASHARGQPTLPSLGGSTKMQAGDKT